MITIEKSKKRSRKEINNKIAIMFNHIMEYVDGELYFIDRVIYNHPLTIKKWFVLANTTSSNGTNRHGYNFGKNKILFTHHKDVLDCEIILDQDAPVLPDASCVGLYNHGVVIKQRNGEYENNYVLYDRVAIMRRYTLLNIITNG